MQLQFVYVTFEGLWHLARKRSRPHGLWPKFFILTNLLTKSLQKIWFANIQNRRPPGFRLNMIVFETFECTLRMTGVQTFFLECNESWVTLSDQWKNHDFEVLNRSIRVQGALIIRWPNIRTSYPMHRSSQPLVFQEPFKRINCSQSVKMKIWCCKEICQIYATRDICWYRFGY